MHILCGSLPYAPRGFVHCAVDIFMTERKMKPQAAKAKGRRLQQHVAKRLLETFPDLHADDVRSTGMGQGGEDVQLSAAARSRIGGYSFECKNVERLNIFGALEQCTTNCGGHEPVDALGPVPGRRVASAR